LNDSLHIPFPSAPDFHPEFFTHWILQPASFLRKKRILVGGLGLDRILLGIPPP